MIIVAEATDKTGALHHRVWEVISDVARWHEWNDAISYIRFKEKFFVGSQGLIRPKQGPEALITLHEIQEGEVCAYTINLFFTRLIVSYVIKQESDGTLIHYKVCLEGLLERFYYVLIHRRVQKEVAETIGKIGVRALQLEHRQRELEKDIAQGRYKTREEIKIDWAPFFASLEAKRRL